MGIFTCYCANLKLARTDEHPQIHPSELDWQIEVDDSSPQTTTESFEYSMPARVGGSCTSCTLTVSASFELPTDSSDLGEF